jgi:NAD-dependent SIR2 family protein deacetylase
MNEYQTRLEKARTALNNADYILLGAGAGLSAAAGLDYAGQRFTDNFADFIEKYGLTDMYTATFYPFPTPEESWAHWARHIEVNRFAQPALPLYKDLLRLVQSKEFFVLTTNVEAQFAKAGFPVEKIFATQGDYAYLQCAKGCHEQLYDNEELIKAMLAHTRDCKIPSSLVPKCPICGGPMAVNLRKDDRFVQDEAWYMASGRYTAFLQKAAAKRIVFLELGVGFNTPGIIRYPFEQMTYRNEQATLIRLNRDYPAGLKENMLRTIAFDEDMTRTIETWLTVFTVPAHSFLS